MIYFPPENNFNYENLGTNFYEIKDPSNLNMNVWQSKYLNSENSKKFYENYKIFYKSKFEINKLVGFIKNEKSWHDVGEFKSNIARKSLNINLYLD